MDDIFSLPLLLHQTTAAWRSILNKRLKPLGLTQAKWRALLHLSRAKGPLTQAELAVLLELEPPTVVGLIDRLAREGWVERRTGQDRRMKYIHLTEQSKDILVTIKKTSSQVQRELLKDINPKNLEICTKVLQQVKEKAEQDYG